MLHPVTKKQRQLLKEHREAHLSKLLNIGTFNNNNLGEIAEIKGYINVLDALLDVESFFEGEFGEDDKEV